MPGFNVGNQFSASCSGQTIRYRNADGSITETIIPGAPGLNGGASIIPNGTETARRNRYILELNGNNRDINFPLIVPLSCESIDRPILRVVKERVWNGADYIMVPLRGEYDPINATIYEILRDDGNAEGHIAIANWTLESILSWWTNSSFNFEHSRPGFTFARKVTATIKQLNGVGASVWAYKLHNCWPEIINPDNLSYKDSDIAKVQVTLNFDKVEEAIDF